MSKHLTNLFGRFVFFNVKDLYKQMLLDFPALKFDTIPKLVNGVMPDVLGSYITALETIEPRAQSIGNLFFFYFDWFL